MDDKKQVVIIDGPHCGEVHFVPKDWRVIRIPNRQPEPVSWPINVDKIEPLVMQSTEYVVHEIRFPDTNRRWWVGIEV